MISSFIFLSMAIMVIMVIYSSSNSGDYLLAGITQLIPSVHRIILN
ncbi:hypothetical protein ACM6Q7_06695 [Peribacillus butanolivorans]